MHCILLTLTWVCCLAGPSGVLGLFRGYMYLSKDLSEHCIGVFTHMLYNAYTRQTDTEKDKCTITLYICTL